MLTNEQKAKRLEELAETFECLGDTDAALLRESAALWRERDGVRWEECPMGYHIALYRRAFIEIQPFARTMHTIKVRTFNGTYSRQWSDIVPTLEAAKAAAIAWVDAQEGK